MTTRPRYYDAILHLLNARVVSSSPETFEDLAQIVGEVVDAAIAEEKPSGEGLRVTAHAIAIALDKLGLMLVDRQKGDVALAHDYDTIFGKLAGAALVAARSVESPCPTCGELDNEICSNPFHLLRKGYTMKDGKVSDSKRDERIMREGGDYKIGMESPSEAPLERCGAVEHLDGRCMMITGHPGIHLFEGEARPDLPQPDSGPKWCPGGPWIHGGEDEHGPVDLCEKCGYGRGEHHSGPPDTREVHK